MSVDSCLSGPFLDQNQTYKENHLYTQNKTLGVRNQSLWLGQVSELGMLVSERADIYMLIRIHGTVLAISLLVLVLELEM